MVQGWKFILEEDFTIDQVLAALKEYVGSKDDVPTPANIKQLIAPPEPEISRSEYLAAIKWQERNQDWSAFSAEAILIADYNRQQQEKRQFHVEHTQRMQQIAAPTPTPKEISYVD